MDFNEFIELYNEYNIFELNDKRNNYIQKTKLIELYRSYVDMHKYEFTTKEFLNKIKETVDEYNMKNTDSEFPMYKVLIEMIYYLEECNRETNFKIIINVTKFIDENILRLYAKEYSNILHKLDNDKCLELLQYIHSIDIYNILSLTPDKRKIVKNIFSNYFNLLKTNVELTKKYDDLEKRYNKLENHVKYMPYSEGYYEAKEHFDSLAKQ